MDPAGTISTLAGRTQRVLPATAARLPLPSWVSLLGCMYGDSRLRLWRARRGAQRRYRVQWARLLARVFQVDLTKCNACAGLMKVTAALTESAAIRKYLDHVGLPSRAPPICAVPQRHLEFHEAA